MGKKEKWVLSRRNTAENSIVFIAKAILLLIYDQVSLGCSLTPMFLATVTASLNARPMCPRTAFSSMTMTPAIVQPSDDVP